MKIVFSAWVDSSDPKAILRILQEAAMGIAGGSDGGELRADGRSGSREVIGEWTAGIQLPPLVALGLKKGSVDGNGGGQ